MNTTLLLLAAMLGTFALLPVCTVVARTRTAPTKDEQPQNAPAPVPVVTGPFRIYVDATPAGATLDVSHYLTAVLLGIAQAAEEEPELLLGELQDLAELSRSAARQGEHFRAARDRDDLAELLIRRFCNGGAIPVYGEQVRRLAERLHGLCLPRPIPRPRDGEAGEAA